MFWPQSAASEQGIEPSASVTDVVRSSVLTFEERGLERQLEAGPPSAVEVMLELGGEIVAEGHQTNPSFARADSKAPLP